MDRSIRMAWNDRNQKRMTKFLKLEYDFAGYILRDGQRIGEKSAQNIDTIVYTFYTGERHD